MNVDTRDLISVTEASGKGVSSLVTDAEAGRPQVILRNNKPAAAMVDMEALERLGRLDELEDDLRLLSIALARMAADTGGRHALDEVAEEFGIDLAGDDEPD